jgi:hypothetical protein
VGSVVTKLFGLVVFVCLGFFSSGLQADGDLAPLAPGVTRGYLTSPAHPELPTLPIETCNEAYYQCTHACNEPCIAQECTDPATYNQCVSACPTPCKDHCGETLLNCLK